MTKDADYISIRISKKNYDKLKTKGCVTDCFNDVNSKLLEEKQDGESQQ